jgi:hypothetical protein
MERIMKFTWSIRQAVTAQAGVDHESRKDLEVIVVFVQEVQVGLDVCANWNLEM